MSMLFRDVRHGERAGGYSLVHRQHDGQHTREVGCCLEEYLAFMEGFPDQFILLVI